MSAGFLRLVFSVSIFALSENLSGQAIDSLQKKTLSHAKESDKVSLLLYARIILDANGNIRIDENIVPNFKLNNWLRLELGFRQGERPQKFDSYNHYKVELQTKSFWKAVRFVARLSDNIIQYPLPTYSKTNYLVLAESKYPIFHSFVAVVAGGYVFSYQKNNSLDGWPTTSGNKINQPIYKVGLRYMLKDAGFIEAVIGTYDVFNPYLLTAPFMQMSFDYDLSERCTLYSYFRYQYSEHIDVPLNDFLGLGVRLHLLK